MAGVLIIGSTGSIGENTLKVLEQHAEEFSVAGLSAHSRWQRLVEQALAYKPQFVHISEEHFDRVKEALSGSGIEVLCGWRELVEAPARPEVEVLVSAIVGVRGLEPLLTGIRHKRRVCFANKEPLVSAGELVMREAAASGCILLPIDSEHSAILQCIQGEAHEDLRRVILTASGGPFRLASRVEFLGAGLEQALKHPTWSMGAKITIDSATMMNKGLEIIEACWLYRLPEISVGVLLHPQSIVHSMVEFRDGSVKAQLGLPDMRIPIQYALSWPRRLELEMPVPDWAAMGALEFAEPDTDKFRSLTIARECSRLGGAYACVMNAANEAAVARFLEGGMPLGRILELVEDELAAYSGQHKSLEELIELSEDIQHRVRSRTS